MANYILKLKTDPNLGCLVFIASLYLYGRHFALYWNFDFFSFLMFTSHLTRVKFSFA